MFGPQLSDLFAHPVVYLYQVSLPVETFKDYTLGAGGQKGRGRLGSGYSTPDDHIHGHCRNISFAGVEDADGVPTHKPGSLIAFEVVVTALMLNEAWRRLQSL
jgi:hypothetical protein